MGRIRELAQKFINTFSDSAASTSPESPVHPVAVAATPSYEELYEKHSTTLKQLKLEKIHYGSGPRLLGEGWLNVDLTQQFDDAAGKVFVAINLVAKHPFPTNYFKFGFAEDFIEHLDQVESLIFLSEVFRTLQPGGVLRLSFPSLGGVLRRHFRASDYEGAVVGQHEAYTAWEHKHFYAEDSLALVARHLGFSEVQFVPYGESKYPELCNLDSRPSQQDLNIYVELTK